MEEESYSRDVGLLLALVPIVEHHFTHSASGTCALALLGR
jgi:hypothetical protein